MQVFILVFLSLTTAMRAFNLKQSETPLIKKCSCPFGYQHKFEEKGWWWNPIIEVCLANTEATATKLPKFDCFYPPTPCIHRDISYRDW